jgi:putative transposase
MAQDSFVLFFIELGTRRVHVAGCTDHPTSTWVTQQARQLMWTLEDRSLPMRFLIHDRDSKFSTAFNTVFASEHIEIVLTPFRAPKANAYAERWIRSVRQECLNHLFIINEQHLRRVLTDYVAYYNNPRPHQGIAQQTPIPRHELVSHASIARRDLLGGLLHDYFRQAA